MRTGAGGDMLSPYVSQGYERMIEQHAWSGVPHDFPHPLFHIPFITMNGAIPAGRFVFSERAA